MRLKKLSVLAALIILLSTGCGASDYLVDKDDNIIKNTETGQTLRNDILCRPVEGTTTYELYKEYEDQLDFKLEELPVCEDFEIGSNETESLWQLIIVKPTAWAIIKVGNIVSNLGLAIIIVGLLIRLILVPLQIKSTRQTNNMKKAAPEIKKLDAKYKNRTDRDSQMAKSQEVMMIYKKYKVNPANGCILAFIQLPVFFAFLDAIYRTPSIYQETMFGWDLGITPLVGIQNGNYSYILLLIMIALSTYFSFKYTMKQMPTSSDEQAKQTKMMLNIMVVFILISSINFPTALHFYWIATYAFIALQTYLIKWYLGERKPKKDKNKPVLKEKIKEKLDKKEGKKNEKDSKRSKND